MPGGRNVTTTSRSAKVSGRLDPRPVAPDNVAGMLRELKEVAEGAFLVEKLGENDWTLSRRAEGIGPPRSNLYK